MASRRPAEPQHELGEVRRALAAKRRERLADLEGIPDRATEGLVHRSQLADDAAAGALPEVEHGLGKHSSPLVGFHERSLADLHVEEDRIRLLLRSSST